MTTFSELATPALVIDVDKLDANLARMSAKASDLKVHLRPHIKTHKCIEIGLRQRDLGSTGITVSTLHEAAVFADHGFNDITWAFPLILSRIDEARRLAETCTLRLVIDSMEALETLEASGAPFRVWLKVDCGYHRAGVDPNGELGPDLAQRLSSSSVLVFDGILTHSGQSYEVEGSDHLRKVAEQERSIMVAFADRLRARGIEVPAVSIGSTPAISVVEDLDGIDEVRPGNYAFYDGTQAALGSCQISDCAVTVIASVVSSPRSATHSVIDAGALALSKDTLPEDKSPSGSTPAQMGQIFGHYDTARMSPSQRLYGLSQEHGLVTGSLPVGSRLRILPNHSCLTVACFDEFVVVKGTEIVDRWKIWRGR